MPPSRAQATPPPLSPNSHAPGARSCVGTMALTTSSHGMICAQVGHLDLCWSDVNTAFQVKVLRKGTPGPLGEVG